MARGLPDVRPETTGVRTVPVAQPGDVTRVFTELANTAEELNRAVVSVAAKYVAEEGRSAVTRGPDGKLKYEGRDSSLLERIFIPELDAVHENAASIAIVAQSKLDVQSQITQLQQQHYEDPDAFRAAVEGLRDANAGAEMPQQAVRAIDELIIQEASRAQLDIANTQISRQYERHRGSVETLIGSNFADLGVLARQGDGAINTPEFRALRDENIELIRGMLNTPEFNLSEEEAQLRIERMDGLLEAEAFTGQVMRIYKEEGEAVAYQAAREFINDPELNLSLEQRDAFLNGVYS